MENATLKIFEIKNDCTGCGACIAACSKHCLSLTYDEEGFLYPKGKMTNCINCHKCERVCHVLNGSVAKNYEKPVWWNRSKPFMFINNETDLRLKSTSGGAMSVFADYIIEQGGVMFASHYNGKQKRLEYSSTDEYPLGVFRKSRYIESNTNNVYSKLKEELVHGRKVLFVGTPCQVSGLKQFLGARSNDDRLLTINFVCHGVPSNEIFHMHVERKYHKNELDNVDFRYKDNRHGWHQMYLKLYNKDKDVLIPYGADEFYRSFCKNDLLRRSCYSCTYLFNDYADITIADFWGVTRYNKDKDDNKGISLVILHNKKAEQLLSLLVNGGECRSLPYNAIDYLLQERKSYNINKRFKGNKEQYLRYMEKQYKWIILKFKIRQWIKAVIRK